ncbi:MAG: class I SAM-dependent methyltransferase [Azospirillum sp.]|nr:class I SAM-dependent methyltransferase [Azospirillum sp.]
MLRRRRSVPAFRRLGQGLATVLGVARHGFFIPCRGAASVPPPGSLPPYPAIEALLAGARSQFTTVLGWIDGLASSLAGFDHARAPEPRWQQDWFPRLDGAAAYALVRRLTPARIVEIGSGHSTRFLARAVRDQGLTTTITAIDPRPRADIARLPVRHLAATVQAAGLAPFAELAAGDLVFIDSSHIAMPGTDVDYLLGRVVAGLPAGVLIHLHDILLPDDYPAEWGWRGYNEQQMVAALLAGGGFEPVFASRYVTTRMAAAVAGSVVAGLPLPPGARETSLWLRKTAPALAPL